MCIYIYIYMYTPYACYNTYSRGDLLVLRLLGVRQDEGLLRGVDHGANHCWLKGVDGRAAGACCGNLDTLAWAGRESKDGVDASASCSLHAWLSQTCYHAIRYNIQCDVELRSDLRNYSWYQINITAVSASRVVLWFPNKGAEGTVQYGTLVANSLLTVMRTLTYV